MYDMQKGAQPKAIDISNDAITLEPKKSLHDARKSLVTYNISRIIVARENKPLGMVTEKDIARYLYTQVPERRLKEVALEEVMSKNLVTVNEKADLNLCAKLMIENKISSLIVTDDKGVLRGIITKSDLVEGYGKFYTQRETVKEYMIEKVLTVRPDEPLHMVLLLMTRGNVSRIVVTRDKRPVGMVTGRDLLPVSTLFGPPLFGDETHDGDQAAIETGATSPQRKEQMFIPSGIRTYFVAKDVMKFDPITISQDSDLADATQIMAMNRISGLPVVDSDGNLVGIITKTDIVKAIADGS
ncbi:MAG TPA: CBS domain-containing protein [Nitrososphaeraceae archaeon]